MTGLNLIFEVRAAIPLNPEGFSTIVLFSVLNSAFMVIVIKEMLKIGSGLFHHTLSKNVTLKENPNLTEFTIYRMEVDQVNGIITSSWSLNGTLEEHINNQVNFPCVEKECRELLMTEFALNISTVFIPLKFFNQDQVNKDISESSCNSMIIDYIRVYNARDF